MEEDDNTIPIMVTSLAPWNKKWNNEHGWYKGDATKGYSRNQGLNEFPHFLREERNYLKKSSLPYSDVRIAIIDMILEEVGKSSLDRIKNLEYRLWWWEEQDWRKSNKYPLLEDVEKDNPNLLQKKYEGRIMKSFRYIPETWYINYLQLRLGPYIFSKK